MEIIKSVQIRRFRSLKTVTHGLDLTHLNIFVGQNDQGKSNILRALNLFFNNETDLNLKFRFPDDYCYHSNRGKGTNREIRIDLIIHPPKGRFKNAKPLKWTKRWKKDGSIVEDRKYIETNEEISSRDNVYKWLDKIRYRYVPAIKGQNYFSSLMGGLHDVLNEAHSETLNLQGEGFISGIQDVTQDITQELSRQIGISNTIQVPSDFKQLFSNLDFGARIEEKTYHLKQRGDGIKIRHIPIILKYMSEQERNVSRAGYVKPDTIWGFEEPENNLELRYAFDLAQSFKKYSKDIQIIATTHSPAFYSLDQTKSDEVNTFYVSQGDDSCTRIKKVMHDDTDDLHEKMGLLPLITPYLKEIYNKEKEIDKIKSQLDVKSNTKCIVLTEDSGYEELKTIFLANNFIDSETEFFSYKGVDNFHGAVVLADYLLEKDPSLYIIIHRDRDYLSDDKINKIYKKYEKKEFYIFVTDGVDVESHYLSFDHLLSVCPELSDNEVLEMIDTATDQCEEDSIGRLVEHTFKNNKDINNMYKRMKDIKKIYINDKERYRYGKKVSGVLKSIAQKKLKRNVDIFIKTNALAHPDLEDMADIIWSIN